MEWFRYSKDYLLNRSIFHGFFSHHFGILLQENGKKSHRVSALWRRVWMIFAALFRQGSRQIIMGKKKIHVRIFCTFAPFGKNKAFDRIGDASN